MSKNVISKGSNPPDECYDSNSSRLGAILNSSLSKVCTLGGRLFSKKVLPYDIALYEAIKPYDVEGESIYYNLHFDLDLGENKINLSDLSDVIQKYLEGVLKDKLYEYDIEPKMLTFGGIPFSLDYRLKTQIIAGMNESNSKYFSLNYSDVDIEITDESRRPSKDIKFFRSGFLPQNVGESLQVDEDDSFELGVFCKELFENGGTYLVKDSCGNHELMTILKDESLKANPEEPYKPTHQVKISFFNPYNGCEKIGIEMLNGIADILHGYSDKSLDGSKVYLLE